ncbi:MAG: hemin uptake protein HemP [Pseudomonadota bacterium]
MSRSMHGTHREPTRQLPPERQPGGKVLALMRGHRDLLIRHGSEIYRARPAASHKLIMTT